MKKFCFLVLVRFLDVFFKGFCRVFVRFLEAFRGF